MKKNPEISIILPCLNERGAIISCLREIKKAIEEHSLEAEAIVVDNGSTDGSADVVLEYMKEFAFLKLVREERGGYGYAYLTGFREAGGKYIFMGDADGTYDFGEIPKFIEKLRRGSDLVIGNRFSGMMEKGSMPILSRIGNPLLSSLVRIFFGVKIKDIHCGARAVSKKALDEITLRTGGMEFASEMVIKAARKNLSISEIPIAYRVRIGKSKLHSFADGWRHLRFILLYSPLFLFFLPGMFLFLFGAGLMALFYFFEPILFGIRFQTHPMFLFSLMAILGYQLILFGSFSKIYAITHLGEESPFFEKMFKYITIERAGIFAVLLGLFGAGVFIYIFVKWFNSGFDSLFEIKNSIVALTLLTIGAETFFSSFILSILGIKEI